MAEQIVIVGGGFGGLEAAFSLKGLLGTSVHITLVNRTLRHWFTPSIHLIVSGKVTPPEISIPLDVVLGAAGIRFVQDEILAVDAEGRQVIGRGNTLSYDRLVLSIGATNNFFGIPGVEQFSCRFRTPDDAEQIHARLLDLLRRNGGCRIMVAGAGTEGVEVVGEVLDLITAEGREDDLAAGNISVELVEGRESLLPSFPLAVRDCAAGFLTQRRASLIAGDRIAEVRQDRVVLTSGRELATSILIWSGGIQPSPLIRTLPFAKDPWGWLKVNDLLQAAGDERIYAIGDAVSVSTENGPLALQRLAYHAQDEARIAAINIAAALTGRSPLRFTARSRPQLISLGGDMGIFSFGDRLSSGAWVVSLKKAIERRHLMGYLSRPVSSAVWSRIPGAGLFQRIRTRLPL